MVSKRRTKPLTIHNDEKEAYLFLHGTGFRSVGDEEIPVGPGTVGYIPAGAQHALANVGDDSLDCVFAPGFPRQTR